MFGVRFVVWRDLMVLLLEWIGEDLGKLSV